MKGAIFGKHMEGTLSARAEYALTIETTNEMQRAVTGKVRQEKEKCQLHSVHTFAFSSSIVLEWSARCSGTDPERRVLYSR